MNIIPDGVSSKINNKRKIIRDRLLIWSENNFRDFPWRKNRTPYSVFICEVLLRRTTAQAVNNIFERFMNKYPSFSIISEAETSEIEGLLLDIGYHKKRSRILKTIAEVIEEKHQGRIPCSIDELRNIPQVGHYIANCVMTFGYGVPTSIVDTNVERILRRLFYEDLEDIKSLKIFRKIAEQMAPLEKNQEYNYALLDLGGLVCKSKNPKCDKCPLTDVCGFFTRARL